jgi:glycerophosphoryl diester phosphodiesterase
VSYLERSGPRVYAHRGGCALGPENTVAAFDLGLAAGADGLELDVHASADGVPVVIHDATLDRTTGASGPVSSKTVAELARVDAGCRFADGAGRRPFEGRGIGVPTLAEVLARYRAVPIIIELKVDTAVFGRRVAQVVMEAEAAQRVCLAGFGVESARGARTAVPAAPASACHTEVRWALYRSWVGWPVRPVAYSAYQVPEHAGRLRVVSPRFVRHAHRAGLAVEVWTVDEADDMQRLLSWGVDGLISNRPDLAVQARDAWVAAAPSRSEHLRGRGF